MWMGGPVPLGYDVKDRALVINEQEAKIVRKIFDSISNWETCGWSAKSCSGWD